MRAVTTAVLVLALGPFLQACFYVAGCNREEAPEFSATDEQITRNDVVTVLGEPIETIKSEDRRVDVYEYDGHCAGLAALGLPFPFFYGTDQMLTVEYGPDGSFLTARRWPDAETRSALATCSPTIVSRTILIRFHRMSLSPLQLATPRRVPATDATAIADRLARSSVSRPSACHELGGV